MKFSTFNNGFKLFEDEIENEDEEHQNPDFIETSPIWSKRIEL